MLLVSFRTGKDRNFHPLARGSGAVFQRHTDRCAHDDGTDAFAGNRPFNFRNRLSSLLRIRLPFFGPIQETFWFLANGRQRRSIAAAISIMSAAGRNPNYPKISSEGRWLADRWSWVSPDFP